MRWMPLWRGPRAPLPLPPCEDTARSLWPWRGPSPNHAGTLTSGFQSPEPWEMDVCCWEGTRPGVFFSGSPCVLRSRCNGQVRGDHDWDSGRSPGDKPLEIRRWLGSGCLPKLQQTGCSRELDVVYERKESRARSRLLVWANGERTRFFSEMGRRQKLHIWEGEGRLGWRHVIPKYNLICLTLCSLFHFWTILEKYLTHCYSHIYTPHIHTYISVLVAQSCPTLCEPHGL